MTNVLFESRKYDGSLNYQWHTELEYSYDNLLILYTPAGTAFTGARRTGAFQYPFRTYLWTDRWYNIHQTYLWGQQRGVRHYVNIALPPTFDGKTSSHVDLDLDLDMDNAWQVELLDEDEFEQHAGEFKYPAGLKQRARQTVRDVQRLIETRAFPFATSVESERLRVRPFFWSDLASIDRWRGVYGPFDDPWLIPAPGTYERQHWFGSYLQTPVCRLYAIETCGGEMIGHISLREIAMGEQSRLGIGLSPAHTGQGYGSEALSAFLDYYFDVLAFERMVLDVAATNVRAIRSYEKVGFTRFGEHYRGAGDESQWDVLRQPQYVNLRGLFRHTAWGLQQLHYDMEITRETWRTKRGKM